jgi:hypothetical protein
MHPCRKLTVLQQAGDREAMKMTRLSCHRFLSNEVRLLLSPIAHTARMRGTTWETSGGGRSGPRKSFARRAVSTAGRESWNHRFACAALLPLPPRIFRVRRSKIPCATTVQRALLGHQLCYCPLQRFFAPRQFLDHSLTICRRSILIQLELPLQPLDFDLKCRDFGK